MNTQSVPRTRVPSLSTIRIGETAGWVALGVMIFASATYNPFAKMLSTSLSAVSLVFLSELLSVLFVFLTFGILPIFRELLSLPKSKILPLFLLGIFNSILAPALIFTGLKSTSAVNAALFSNSEMLFLLLFAFLFFGERLRKAHVLSLGVILLGLITVAMRGFSESLSLQLGDALLIGAGLLFGIGDTIFRRRLSDMHPHTIVLGRSLIAISACILFGLLSPISVLDEVRSFPLTLLPILIGFGFFSRFVTLVSFYDALERLPVSAVALFSYLGIIISIVFSHWLLAETIHGYHFIGGALVIGGAICVEWSGKHHRSEEHYKAHLKQKRFSRS